MYVYTVCFFFFFLYLFFFFFFNSKRIPVYMYNVCDYFPDPHLNLAFQVHSPADIKPVTCKFLASNRSSDVALEIDDYSSLAT